MKIDFCQLKERDSNPPFVFQDWRDAEFFKAAFVELPVGSNYREEKR